MIGRKVMMKNVFSIPFTVFGSLREKENSYIRQVEVERMCGG